MVGEYLYLRILLVEQLDRGFDEVFLFPAADFQFGLEPVGDVFDVHFSSWFVSLLGPACCRLLKLDQISRHSPSSFPVPGIPAVENQRFISYLSYWDGNLSFSSHF